jgi:hypothetical protein
MKNNHLTLQQRILLPIGLLFTSGSLLINDFFKLPDFVRGAMEGFGIGLMLIALINIRRLKGSSCGRLTATDKPATVE